MRAIVVTAYGDVDKLEVRNVPEPSAGADEVKVRVTASSVNPIDWKLRLCRVCRRQGRSLGRATGGVGPR